VRDAVAHGRGERSKRVNLGGNALLNEGEAIDQKKGMEERGKEETHVRKGVAVII
jgi:hypothetical protein